MPAATVALLIGSIRMKLPVARFEVYASKKIGRVVSIATEPISFSSRLPAGSPANVLMLILCLSEVTVAVSCCVVCLIR